MTIGFRNFIEMCDEQKIVQIVEKLDGALSFEPFAVLTDVVGPIDNYDFGAIFSQLPRDDRERLLEYAYALGNDLQLPDRFAIVFTHRETRAVAVFGCGSMIQGIGGDGSQHFRATIFRHDGQRDHFAYYGDTCIGGWVSPTERRQFGGNHWEPLGHEFTDEVLCEISECLSVFLMLLHLRTEDEITVLTAARPSDSHNRLNAQRARLGQLPLLLPKIVWVGVEPLKRWIASRPSMRSCGSKSPHDRRGYYRRPRGGHEKTHWVRAARIHGGAQEPGIRETAVRLRHPSTKTIQ